MKTVIATFILFGCISIQAQENRLDSLALGTKIVGRSEFKCLGTKYRVMKLSKNFVEHGIHKNHRYHVICDMAQDIGRSDNPSACIADGSQNTALCRNKYKKIEKQTKECRETIGEYFLCYAPGSKKLTYQSVTCTSFPTKEKKPDSAFCLTGVLKNMGFSGCKEPIQNKSQLKLNKFCKNAFNHQKKNSIFKSYSEPHSAQ